MNRSLIPSAALILLLFVSVPPLLADQAASEAATPASTPPAAKEVGPAFPMAHVPAGKGLVLREGSRLWIQGSTDQRSFELWAGALSGSAILNAPLGAGAPDALLAEVKHKGVQTMTLEVPIVQLQASDPEVERGSDYALAGPSKTLQAKDNPNVEFRLGKAKLGKEVRPGVYSLQVPGELSIGGASEDILLKAEAVFSGDQVRVSGHYQVHLAVFKVKILEDVWGAMGPKPSVEVYYDVTFAPPPAP
jgi:hypothetical protein